MALLQNVYPNWDNKVKERKSNEALICPICPSKCVDAIRIKKSGFREPEYMCFEFECYNGHKWTHDRKTMQKIRIDKNKQNLGGGVSVYHFRNTRGGIQTCNRNVS